MVTYQQAGVSVKRGNELVQRIKKLVSKSAVARSAIGGFSAIYPIKTAQKKIFLSACCDGVGTKLKIAFLMNRHDTIGIDLVAMNVNDLLCSFARPLFFLDYFACGKLNLKIAETVIAGIQKGCEQAGCVLLGGETAEMPGFYKEDEYDLAGFAVGIAEERYLAKRAQIREGDIVFGLPSSGLHSNGFSLVRKIFSKQELIRMGKELLTPTRIYVQDVLPLLTANHSSLTVKGMAHITGGGWLENIPRILPDGLQVEIWKNSWEVPEIFLKIQKEGKVTETEMFRTFNMGIGMILIAEPSSLSLAPHGEESRREGIEKFLKEAKILGRVSKGTKKVVFH